MDANQQVAYSTRGVGPRQLRRLRTMHENLARDFGAALSGLLRTAVDVSLAGVDQLAYGQFVCSLASPACFYVLKAEPFDDRPMLDIEPAILHPMIDRLLGGAVDDEPPPGRPLTEIELCLAARIVRLFLQECRSAWQKVLDLKLEVLQAESNPRLLRILPTEEPVVLIRFEVSIGELRGMMRLCLAARAIEGLGDKLLPDGSSPINHPQPHTLATVEVTLAETQISSDELADLRVGDIIATETAADSPMTVSIDGIGKFRGKPGAFQGRKAVRLTDSIEKDER
jgi:flagellar motor switch protein FliM